LFFSNQLFFLIFVSTTFSRFSTNSISIRLGVKLGNQFARKPGWARQRKEQDQKEIFLQKKCFGREFVWTLAGPGCEWRAAALGLKLLRLPRAPSFRSGSHLWTCAGLHSDASSVTEQCPPIPCTTSRYWFWTGGGVKPWTIWWIEMGTMRQNTKTDWDLDHICAHVTDSGEWLIHCLHFFRANRYKGIHNKSGIEPGWCHHLCRYRQHTFKVYVSVKSILQLKYMLGVVRGGCCCLVLGDIISQGRCQEKARHNIKIVQDMAKGQN